MKVAIVPQVARDVGALATSSIAAHHLLCAAAAVIALLASAAGYHLLRHPVPAAPVGRTSALPLKYAQAAPLSAGEESAPSLAAESTPVRPAPMSGNSGAKAADALRPALLAAKEDTAIEELRLLKRAQLSAARGDHATVLTVTTDHRRRYPRGRLCEEREALRLQALIGLHRDHEAREVAARFRQDFPRSVVLSKLDDMLASSP